MSDIHVLDEESPARVEYFDGCSGVDRDLSSAYPSPGGYDLQVGDSMIRRLNAITEGPATGVALDFMISTGDNIDNNQQNEHARFVDLLDGDIVDPNSGTATYDGYTLRSHSHRLAERDVLALAQAAFRRRGFEMCLGTGSIGNHDGLVQGTSWQPSVQHRRERLT